MRFPVEYKELEERGLIKVKRYPNGNKVLKYTRKVFFNNLWHLDPLLVNCRGLVLDAEDHIIMWPFTKCYNYLENGAGGNLLPHHKVRIVEKLNGFLGNVSSHKYQYITGTTSTLDSDYAELAKKVINRQATPGTFNPNSNYTWMFEICDASDPHIVEDVEGAYLIGMRNNQTGAMLSEHALDLEAQACGFLRPRHMEVTFQEALRLRKEVKHEGFMIQDLDGNVICKMKSFHYLAKKALMRKGKNRAALMFNNTVEFKKQIDEEFYLLVDWLVEDWTLEDYVALSSMERRKLIEAYFNTREAF